VGKLTRFDATTTAWTEYMLFRRLANGIRDQNWGVISLELVVLTIGILLAFQVDRVYEGWQDRQLEGRYLERLRVDLQSDTAELAEVLARTETRLAQLKMLVDVANDPGSVGDDGRAFIHAIEQVTWRSVPTITTYTYDELGSTGRMTLLRSEALRKGVAEYYAFIEEQRRLGLGEDDQDYFRSETLGILSGAQLGAIEDPSRYALDVSSEEVKRIATEFASRKTARAWLGRLEKYQVLMGRLASDFDTRAQILLGQLDRELTNRR
jgi:hypothetical protein